ncbi:MAG: beta strand repeat-containing protein [Pyrinomonadaceae bacterium]
MRNNNSVVKVAVIILFSQILAFPVFPVELSRKFGLPPMYDIAGAISQKFAAKQIYSNVSPATPPIDSDGDGIDDSTDQDDDNDGVPDTTELYCTSGKTYLAGPSLIQSITTQNAIFPLVYANAPLPQVWFDGDIVNGQSTFAPANTDADDFSSTPVILTITFTGPTIADGFVLANDFGVTGDGIKNADLQIFDSANNLLGTESYTSLSTASSGASEYPFSHQYTDIKSMKIFIKSTYSGGGTGLNRMQMREIGMYNMDGFCSPIDFDGDGVPDYLDLDSDNDGISDLLEAGGLTNAQIASLATMYPGGKYTGGVNSTGIPNAANGGTGYGRGTGTDYDADNDGIPDAIEAQPTTGYISVNETNVNAQGITNNGSGLYNPQDTDGDGTKDFLDLDSDNDTLSDDAETLDTISPNYQYTDGGVTPSTMTNQFGDTSEVAYREVPYDFGDAPDATSGTAKGDYQTMLANNGPRHAISIPTYYLGTAPSGESDATTNATATADANDDGVKLGTASLQGSTFNQGIPVNLTVTAGGSAKLFGWIDWNQNGVFGDTPEEIIISETTDKSTARTIPITPPASAIVGQTYARFRYSTDSNLTPLGAANNGEVEDYQINVLPSVSLRKTSVGTTGSFNFTLTNADTNSATTTVQTTAAITTTTDGTAATFDGNTTATGVQPIQVLANGDVTVSETPQAGWTLTSATCTNGTSTWNLSGSAVTIAGADYLGQASGIACNFTNTRLSISGTVFDDVNYGGGAGRNLQTSGGVGTTAARVELYNASGTWVAATTTDASGNYNFDLPATGDYFVRVVNSTVHSARTGWVSSMRPVQSFRTDASTGTVIDVTDRVGGENPMLPDSGNSNTTLAAITTAANIPQSVTPVKVTASPVTNVDFGFNFDTIVNTNDSGQGSLRQFIANSNGLSNTGLSQQGLTSGDETSIFMISDGAAHPGLRSGLANQLTGGVAIISATSVLPTISATNTSIDGTTQTANVGNTNSGVQGAGGTVGVSGNSFSTVDKPEVQVSTTLTTLTSGLAIGASNTTVRGLAVTGFGTTVNTGNIVIVAGTYDDVLIEKNYVGSTAASFTQPSKANTGANIVLQSTLSNSKISNNLIGFAQLNGISGGSGASTPTYTNLLIENNEIRQNGIAPTTSNGAGIEIIRTAASASSLIISKNLIVDNSSQGIQLNFISGTQIAENTLTHNGIVNNIYPTEQQGILMYRTTSSTISKNVVSLNGTDGITIDTVSGSGSNYITQNSTFDNGALGINLGAFTTTGVINPNNGTLNTSLANYDMDYPIFTEVRLVGSTLYVKGYVGNNPAGSSVFANSKVEIFKADNNPVNPTGEVILGDGSSVSHGEGSTYLGTLTTDGNGIFNGSFAVSGLTTSDFITSTATSTTNNTSEFSANYSTQFVPLYGFKSVKITNDADSSGDASPGDTLTWTLAYANTGSASISNFQIADVLPSGLTITSAGAQTVTVSGTGTTASKATTYTGVAGSTANLLSAGATLPVGGMITVSIPVTIGASAAQSLKSNQASATGTGAGVTGTNFLTDNVAVTSDIWSTVSSAPFNATVPTGSATQTITGAIDPTTISIYIPSPTGYKSVKLTNDADSSNSITPGDTVTYTIYYVNSITSSLSNFQINDVLPSGLTITAAGAQTVTGATKNPSYTGAAAGAGSDLLAASQTLAGQSVISVSIPATINAGGVGTFSNQATATSPSLAVTVSTDNVGKTADLPALMQGAPYNLTVQTGSVAQTLTAATDPTTFSIAAKPILSLLKDCTVPADCKTNPQMPGTDLTYTIQMTNGGTSDATQIALIDYVPDNTDFKIGSAAIDSAPSGVSIAIEYSMNYDPLNPGAATWTYSPTSAGGGADAGYDRKVKAIRWRVTSGVLSTVSPDHTATVSFITKIR